MKLILNKNQLNESPEMFLRHAGYGYIRDSRRDAESFVRRLGSGFYPRLHMYVEENNSQIIFNLHLDQRQPSYAGSHMHNAEYDGAAVEQEIARLKNFLSQISQPLNNAAPSSQNENLNEPVDRVGGERKFIDKEKNNKKKSWWKFWQ